jgi:hypothetical protein
VELRTARAGRHGSGNRRVENDVGKMKRTKHNPWPFSSKATSARNTTPARGGIAAHSRAKSGDTTRLKSRSKAAASVEIDEAKLAAHFKKGGTLAEFLQLNPSDYEAGKNARGLSPAGRARLLKEHIEWVERVERGGRKLSTGELKVLRQRFGAEARRPNPADVTDRAHRYRAQKNVTGPRKCVLCGSTRNIDVMHLDGNESHDEAKNLAYGCRSCNGKLAAAFKRAGMGRPTNQYNPAGSTVPTFGQYAWAVSQGGPRGHRLDTGSAHDEAGAVIHATPKHKRIEYARRIAEGQRARRRTADNERWNPADNVISIQDAYIAKVAKYSPKGYNYAALVTKAARKARADLERLGYSDTEARAIVRDAHDVAQLKRNPAAEAAKGFKDFHGESPSEFVEVKERVHVHRHLSGAGKLERLVVAAIDGRANVTLSGFGGAILAFNEARNQLFVTGGDQAVDLKAFGIRPKEAHELETLGRVLSLDYSTNKTHLGDEGGAAVYRHKLRTTNENGRHVTVRIARYPDLIYRVRDKHLEFSGGSYQIIPEGIDR